MEEGMQFSGVFWKIVKASKTHPRYISSVGGTRSTKTYSMLQFLHLLIPRADKNGDITSVVSETLPHLKRGCIRDFEKIIGHSLKTDDNWNATDLIYTYPNGAKLEFFSADSSGKVHGPARKRLACNEGNHLSYEVFRQLALRTTGIIFIDYNPSETCWINEIVEAKKNCVRIHSTYKDNPFLSKEQIAEIEDGMDDPNFWKVYGLGEMGTLDGLIYSFELIDALPEKVDLPENEKTDAQKYADTLIELEGMDFGFVNDPTARVHCMVDKKRKHIFVQERCYRTHMKNGDIIEDLKEDGVDKYTPIYADCAEPKSIAEIIEGGFNVIACDKDAPVKSDKLKFQLNWMQGWKLFVTKDSVNLIKELRNYTWEKDRNNTLLSRPIDRWNHALDAMRYCIWSHFGVNAGSGEYNISFSRRHGRHH